MKHHPYYTVFDVESIGLHGEGFSVGYVVIDSEGTICEADAFACSPDRATGSDEGRGWVAAHVPAKGFYGCHDPQGVRDGFWRMWCSWKDRGAVLIADYAWPVEARFLIDCVNDDPYARQWMGPYPLHELASFMIAAGMDLTTPYERLPDEPQHDPLGDARHSARLLIRALSILRSLPAADVTAL